MANRILLVTALLGACSHDLGPSQKGEIGPSGGTVSAGQSASVELPPGALGGNTTITVTPSDAAPPTSTLAVGTPYLFGPEGTQFAVPVTVTLEYSPTLLPSGMTATDIVVYTAPADTTDYQSLTTTIVDDTHVSAQTTHFSIFVATVASPQNGSGVDAGAKLDAAVKLDAGSAAACPPNVSGGLQQCVLSATCNGVSYSATCQDTGSGSSSWCLCGPNSTKVYNISGTCTSSTGQPGWGACGYP
jgi:hypothetical protein